MKTTEIYCATTFCTQTRKFPPKKFFSTQRKNFLYFLPKQQFFERKNFYVRLKEPKKPLILETKIIFCNERKKSFPNKKISYTLFLIREFLYFRCFLNMAMLFFITENITQSLFCDAFLFFQLLS